MWQQKDLIFPPFQNYLQVPCQTLKKGTTEGHHEHQLTPKAGQMIYHISQVSQPTNTLQIKKKQLFELKAHACMQCSQVTLYSAAYFWLKAWFSLAHKHKDMYAHAKWHNWLNSRYQLSSTPWSTRWRTKMMSCAYPCVYIDSILTSQSYDISITTRTTNMSVLLVLLLMPMSLVFSLAYTCACAYAYPLVKPDFNPTHMEGKHSHCRTSSE